MSKDPTQCDRCSSSLDRGWSERWRTPEGGGDPVRVEAICFDCNDTERVYQYNKDKILTGPLITSATLRVPPFRGEKPHRYIETYRRVKASYDKIHDEIKSFERAVWFAGLQGQVNAASNRGFKMTFGDSIAMVYSLAGRTQITIESGDNQVSVITADNSKVPVMGLNSLSAKEEDALRLLRECAQAYKGGARFLQDDKVGIAGF